jgi:predicted transcriptional regulator
MDAFDSMFSTLLNEGNAAKTNVAANGNAQLLGNTGQESGCSPAPAANGGTVTGSSEVDCAAMNPTLFNRKAPQYVRQQELPWHRVALERAALGYTAREIAEQLGCSPTAVQDILRQPQYQHLQVNLIKKELTKDQIVVDTIRENVVLAVETLADIMSSEKSKASDRINAAKELLNRRYGMPNQPINRNTDVDLNKLSDKELADMLTVKTGTNR